MQTELDQIEQSEHHRRESSERRVRDRSRQVGRDDRYICNGIVVVIKNATILDGMPQVNRYYACELIP
jgi:hypothetical protein